MKSLEIVQKLAKIAEIVCKVIYICALVGCGACAVGLILLPLGAGEILKLGGVTIHGILSRTVGVPQACVTLAGSLVVCAGEAVVARFARNYFTRELQAGTPFTREGAKELQTLGILTLTVPFGCAMLAYVAQEVAGQLLDADFARWMGPEGSVTLGVMLLVVSLLCRCAAEEISVDS